jgi:hypothetical protein
MIVLVDIFTRLLLGKAEMDKIWRLAPSLAAGLGAFLSFVGIRLDEQTASAEVCRSSRILAPALAN